MHLFYETLQIGTNIIHSEPFRGLIALHLVEARRQRAAVKAEAPNQSLPESSEHVYDVDCKHFHHSRARHLLSIVM